MSKKLDSILQSVPTATAVSVQNETPKITSEGRERVVAVVPSSVKRQIKQYIVDHPGETEKTVLLRGLVSLGFEVSDCYLQDLRGRKHGI